MGDYIVVIGVVLGFFGISLAYTLINLLRVCDPSEVLIVSGRSDYIGQKKIGYNYTRGGSMVVLPIVNKAHRMDLRIMTIDVSVHAAYSHGGIPLHISGVANLKVCGDQPLLNNAVERFLGRSRVEIMKIAKETLEGNIRGVLAKLTPEQVNQDKQAFAQHLIEEADKDLQRLGLSLDNLQIQNVRDDAGYLECLGRKKQAEVIMRSKIAEAENKSSSKVREAENRERSTLIEIENQMKILKAEAETKIMDARTRREAVVAQQNAVVAKEIAKAEAEIAVQTAKIEQIRHQLRADIVAPAEAARQQCMADAKAGVAPMLENGRATAKMLEDLTQALKRAGGNARDIFLVQKLDSLLASLLRTIQAVNIDRVTFVDQKLLAGDGWASMPAKLAVGAEQLRSTMNVDVPELLAGLSAGAARVTTPATVSATVESAEPSRHQIPPTPEEPAQQRRRK